ncbi:hypothetical protein LCGC14_2902740 [marine sediment metagenome]|uniref:Uncharacterized protein n=1 Tax=marine sediment metagenome TaxID=412755 RepID=A0A0F8XTW1_9ZZZZ
MSNIQTRPLICDSAKCDKTPEHVIFINDEVYAQACESHKAELQLEAKEVNCESDKGDPCLVCGSRGFHEITCFLRLDI